MGEVDGRRRVVIEGIKPEIDGGLFPIKRTVGEKVRVEADVFADGHDAVRCQLLYRKKGQTEWTLTQMSHVVNDRWEGMFYVTELGTYEYTVQAWVDKFLSWHHGIVKKIPAAQDSSVDFLVGANLLESVLENASASDQILLKAWAAALRSNQLDQMRQCALDEQLVLTMLKYPSPSPVSVYHRTLNVHVDREKARFSAWYELFPRSCAAEVGRHGTFKDCEARLPYVAGMGFDVLYLPPIHPIGRTHRKGRNNSVTPTPDDPGSPWAIGSEEGGHKAIHSDLGTLEDFRSLVRKAGELGLEVALDLAYQCTPDHPYVKSHPEWFRRRPDGTIQYAENPPKKYQDIYPIDFETEKWSQLWEELKSVVLFWMDQGVKIFRVDNPHTKAFLFWEWLIAEIHKVDPEVIFLSEAFTRPKVMYRLAKLGFTQSYTYFAWRNTKWELTEYFQELTQGEVREYFRPNLWPNTPDILTEYLQIGGRPAFMSRLVLAATLGPNYGIYGPAFELCENRPLVRGKEEYLDSEKYEIRHWDLARPDSLRDLIARINSIRKSNPALQSNDRLVFLPVDNEQLIAHAKTTEDLSNVILVVVNLDCHYKQSGWIDLPLAKLGLEADHPFQVHDLLTDARYFWHGSRNYIELNPHVLPAHILRVRRRVRTEQDFDYFM
ncbi:MAG: alpha-1,4-glucan--maltose-1-phosphate maltosyltransferase [Acidobacteriota bacterium]